jgi:FkbM family methyltransferase
MLNFSRISRSSVAGRALRAPLAFIPKGMPVWILQGKLRGYRWISNASTHGCWLGSYEMPKQTRFAAALQRNQVVYDVGANVGFYSLLASACVGPIGRVFAFEPLPENVAFIERHASLNHCSNISIQNVAVSAKSGQLRFQRGASCETGRLSDNGNIPVTALSLDEFVYTRGNPAPQVIKMDVEGAEEHALRGAAQLLRHDPPIIFLATHSPQLHATCCELLFSAGYRLEAADGGKPELTDELICFPESAATLQAAINR